MREPGIYEDVPETEYHRDAAFSQSQAKVLLESPAKYKWELEHPAERSTAAMDVGKAVHAEVLGVGADIAVIPEEYLASNGAASTTKARKFIEEATARGIVAVKASAYAEIRAMAAAVLGHAEARSLFEREGKPEVSMWWPDPATGIICRGRVDWYTRTEAGLPLNVDYKTAEDAGPSAFARSAANYGYHTQVATYDLALRTLLGLELTAHKLVAQEKKPPYFVGVYHFEDWDLSIGLDRWRAAVDRLAWCLEHGEWPGYAGGGLVMPGWS